MIEVKNGQTVSVHYVGTFEDGTEFDSSHTRGEPIMFEVGSGQMISGFDNALLGMSIGDKKDITLEPEDAYGITNPDAFQTFSLDSFPPEVDLSEGVTVVGQDQQGQQMIARVEKLTDESATLDFNHPMAGKRLSFSLELISIT